MVKYNLAPLPKNINSQPGGLEVTEIIGLVDLVKNTTLAIGKQRLLPDSREAVYYTQKPVSVGEGKIKVAYIDPKAKTDGSIPENRHATLVGEFDISKIVRVGESKLHKSDMEYARQIYFKDGTSITAGGSRKDFGYFLEKDKNFFTPDATSGDLIRLPEDFSQITVSTYSVGKDSGQITILGTKHLLSRKQKYILYKIAKERGFTLLRADDRSGYFVPDELTGGEDTIREVSKNVIRNGTKGRMLKALLTQSGGLLDVEIKDILSIDSFDSRKETLSILMKNGQRYEIHGTLKCFEGILPNNFILLDRGGSILGLEKDIITTIDKEYLCVTSGGKDYKYYLSRTGKRDVNSFLKKG